MRNVAPEHDRLARLAAGHGFEIVGVTDASVLAEDLVRLETWAAAGHGADLGYMTRNPPQRADPRTLQGSVQSVVSVAVAYPHDDGRFEANGRYGRVARYAWGRDYHDLVRPRLEALAIDVARAFGGSAARGACDHSPLLERAVAARAGLGFIGKNTCLILPRQGSWWFLGEVLVDAVIPPTSAEPAERHCGTCVSCLVACPTQAFPAPYVLDARRCISYLTIEYAGVIPRDLRRGVGAWLFGCDVCQEVCPFQREHPPTPWAELLPQAGTGSRLDLGEVLALDDDRFARHFAGTPLLRPGRVGLQRNALLVARNVGAQSLTTTIGQFVDAPEPVLRIHALDALAHLDRQRGRDAAERLLRDPVPEVRQEAALVLAELA